MTGQRVELQIVLADGSLKRLTGLVSTATSEAADGGFARYILTVRPWIALLAHTRQSRVWQEKSFIDTIESVLARYQRYAQWSWAADVADHLAMSPFSGTSAGTGNVRSYTVQYRETDLDFVQRMLAEEGIAWRLQDDPSAPYVHHRGLKRQDESDRKIIQFFERYVHDSLADFQMDSTLPSDPRVIYIGGAERYRYAKTDPAGATAVQAA